MVNVHGEDGFKMSKLCYANNPKSLFRKYAPLVTAFATSQEGKKFIQSKKSFFNPQNEVMLFLPNGWIEKMGDNRFLLKVATRPVFSSILSSTLTKIDIACETYKMPFEDLLEMMFIDLGLRGFSTQYPQVFLTVGTFNPDPDPENTSVDGSAVRLGQNVAFSTLRSGAGTFFQNGATISGGSRIQASGTTNQYQGMGRDIFLYDISSISGATINETSNTKKRIYLTSTRTGLGGNVRLVQSNPISNTAIENADFNIARWPTPTAMASEIAFTSLNTSAYNDFVLNSTAVAFVQTASDGDGIVKFGFRNSFDANNSAPTWSGNAVSDMNGEVHSETGSNEPTLSVDYTALGIASMRQLVGVGQGTR